MSKNIVVINGHPDDESLCSSIADKYISGARNADHKVEYLCLRELKFDYMLHHGFRLPQDLEPDILRSQEKIRKADHVVFITPLWWGSMTGLLKCFMDRVLVNGFSQQYNPNTKKMDKLLKGKTASVIYTQSASKFATRFLLHDGFWHMFKNGSLRFCGFEKIKRCYFSKISKKSKNDIGNILIKIEKLGKNGF